jgi:2-polyprenyl-3-methyl-5-hydroxy-6-metoxy-1,4-benzoquinol methylase
MTATEKEVAAEREAHEIASGCCSPPADPRIARRFDQTSGEWTDGDGFPDMVDVSAKLLDLLRDAPLRRPSVLEMGSGTGGLSIALLEMGAAHVSGVDLSQASVDLARRRSVEAGVADRATFEVGNAVEAATEPHDWVVLDRVICCFAHCERLVARATELARERIGITLPESRGWRGLVNRPLWAAENVWDLVNGGCRGYVHDLRRIEQRLAAAGFQAGPSARVGLWHIGIYDRG